MGRVSDAKERLMSAVSELIWTGSYGNTTIDQICERAGVKKGSFYYFFTSKSDLAKAAIEVEWAKERESLDRVFSPTVPPLERLRLFTRRSYETQRDLRHKYGHTLGCPLCNLGSEVSTLEGALCEVVQGIMHQARRYFETTIRDAQAAGLIPVADPATKARAVYSYSEGVLTQARIEDNPELLLEMEQGILDILGASSVIAQPS